MVRVNTLARHRVRGSSAIVLSHHNRSVVCQAHLDQRVVTPVHGITYVQGFMMERRLVTNYYKRSASQVFQTLRQILPLVNCLQVPHNVLTSSIVHVLLRTQEIRGQTPRRRGTE